MGEPVLVLDRVDAVTAEAYGLLGLPADWFAHATADVAASSSGGGAATTGGRGQR